MSKPLNSLLSQLTAAELHIVENFVGNGPHWHCRHCGEQATIERRRSLTHAGSAVNGHAQAFDRSDKLVCKNDACLGHTIDQPSWVRTLAAAL